MKKNIFIILLICIVFFVISFISNIFSSINPDIKRTFHLTLAAVALLKFSSWIAYGVFSIPSGLLTEKLDVKPVLVIAFLLAFIGSFSFALFPNYYLAFISLFLIGTCMAMLQVALNPLLRVVGGEEHFAFNLVLVQLVFGLGSFFSPRVYSYLALNLGSTRIPSNIFLRILSSVVPPHLSWVSLYWIFTLISLVMLVIMIMLRIPHVELKEDERVGAWETNKRLFKNKTVIMFFIGIFAYVGTEQGMADWISQFLATYHGFDPQIDGARIVSWFWGLFTAGTVLGLILLKITDSRNVLKGFAVLEIICLSSALFGSSKVALIAFPLFGLFASSMWGIIFSLGLNSMEKHHGALSGILCTGIAGGAVVPLIIGWLGDLFGLRFGLMFLYCTLGYILSIGFWANPLVTNKTINFRKKKAY